MARDVIHRERRNEYVFKGRCFKGANDNNRRARHDRFFPPIENDNRFVDIDLRTILARAIGVAAGVALLGGFALTGAITLFAQIFGSTELAEHRNMGFMMGSAAGFGLSLWYLMDAVRARRNC